MVNCEVPKDDASRLYRVSWLFHCQARLLGASFSRYTDYIQQTLLWLFPGLRGQTSSVAHHYGQRDMKRIN